MTFSQIVTRTVREIESVMTHCRICHCDFTILSPEFADTGAHERCYIYRNSRVEKYYPRQSFLDTQVRPINLGHKGME